MFLMVSWKLLISKFHSIVMKFNEVVLDTAWFDRTFMKKIVYLIFLHEFMLEEGHKQFEMYRKSPEMNKKLKIKWAFQHNLRDSFTDDVRHVFLKCKNIWTSVSLFCAIDSSFKK